MPDDETLIPKDTLPLTHAVVVYDVRQGEWAPITAVEFRSDGHHAVLSAGSGLGFSATLLHRATVAAATKVLLQSELGQVPDPIPHPELPCAQ